MESHINETVEAPNERDCCSFGYHQIARDTGYDIEYVRRVLVRVDCGHNGLTVWLPGGYKRWHQEFVDDAGSKTGGE